MLQLCSARDPSLGECNVEVSLCISLSRGKWFGSDSNDQINYPTSQASTLLDEQSMMSHPGSLTDRETDLVVVSFLSIEMNHYLNG